MGMQAPINSVLGKSIGTFAAASVSFAIGLVVLVAITVVAGGGFGDVGKAGDLSWVYLTGGLLGAAYVTTVLVSVRTLGAGGVAAATIAGQLAMSVLLDRTGALGIAGARPDGAAHDRPRSPRRRHLPRRPRLTCRVRAAGAGTPGSSPASSWSPSG